MFTAITESTVIVFDRYGLDELSNTIIGWDKIVHQITTEAFLEKVNRISPMLAQNATARYKNFAAQYLDACLSCLVPRRYSTVPEQDKRDITVVS